MGGGARAHRARRRGRARRADRAGRTRLRRVARAAGWRGHRALRSRSRRRARRDRDHPRAARVPADPRRSGAWRSSPVRDSRSAPAPPSRPPAPSSVWFPAFPRSARFPSRPPRGCCCSRCCRSPSARLAGWIARSRLVAPPAVAEAAPPALPIDADAAPATPPAARHSRLCWRVSTTPRPPGAAEQASLGADDCGARARTMRRRARSPTRSPIGSARGRSSRSASPCSRPRARPCCPPWRRGRSGPGRLAEVGPQPGAVALAVGLEVLLGAAILLLSPRRRPKAAPTRAKATEAAAAQVTDAEIASDAEPTLVAQTEAITPATEGAAPAPEVAASDRPRSSDPDSTPTVDLGPRRPSPLPPVD